MFGHLINTQEKKHRPTQGIVCQQILVGQFQETLDSFQRHFGLQDAIEHPGESIKRNDQHPHQGKCGEHLQERRASSV